MIRRILCALGFHGVHLYRSAPFERTCEKCGAVYRGREVETRYTRTVGDWRRVN